MSGITLAQAQAKLDALMAASETNTLRVRFAEREVTYRSGEEILNAIKYWNRMVKELSRITSGPSIKLADFR